MQQEKRVAETTLSNHPTFFENIITVIEPDNSALSRHTRYPDNLL